MNKPLSKNLLPLKGQLCTLKVVLYNLRVVICKFCLKSNFSNEVLNCAPPEAVFWALVFCVARTQLSVQLREERDGTPHSVSCGLHRSFSEGSLWSPLCEPNQEGVHRECLPKNTFIPGLTSSKHKRTFFISNDIYMFFFSWQVCIIRILHQKRASTAYKMSELCF